MYEFLKSRMEVDVLRLQNMTYETSNKEATESIKVGFEPTLFHKNQNLSLAP